MEPFLILIDRIIKLLGVHRQNKRQLFREIIEPLFNELQPVVDEYFLLFWNAREAMKLKSRNELEIAINNIKNARERILHTRVKVLKFAQQVRDEISDKKVIVFCDKIALFFFSSEFLKHPPPTSHAAELVEVLDYAMQGRIDKSEFQNYIARTLRNLENCWTAIAQSYAALRVYSLKP